MSITSACAASTGQANLAVRQRKKGKRPNNERVPLQLARKVNEVWSMD